ncbi:FtsK/SpoIIIE domain-containing protein [Bacillus thuringiensis]|nr:FtsK/SpoIIIE domain-containing protein [Bacillus thuringiensis]
MILNYKTSNLFDREKYFKTKNIINKKKLVRKEIELSYDGLLKIRVYEKGIPNFVKSEEGMMRQCRGWEVSIGYTRDGLVKHDFDQLSHMISVGMTDMGKSNVSKLIITSLVRNQSENIKLFLIDLKDGLSFNRYRSNGLRRIQRRRLRL